MALRKKKLDPTQRALIALITAVYALYDREPPGDATLDGIAAELQLLGEQRIQTTTAADRLIEPH